MQKRIDTPIRGVALLFRKDALRFVQRWQAKHKMPTAVHFDWIIAVNEVAEDSPLWSNSMKRQAAVGVGLEPLESSPDFKRYLEVTGGKVQTDLYLARALLVFLKKKWARLERSQFGRLKIFLAHAHLGKWQAGFGAKRDDLGSWSIWDLQDGGVAKAFEQSPGGHEVRKSLVTKARKWVAKNVHDGQAFAAKVLDSDGFLVLKGPSGKQ